MDCRTARDMGSRLLDWDLSREEQADLQLHLAGCPDCREELNAAFALQRALVRLKEDQVEAPAELAGKVMGEVMAAPPFRLAFHRAKAALFRRVGEIVPVFRGPARTRAALSAGALALAAAVVIGSFYLNNPMSPTNVAVRPARPATAPPVTQHVVPPVQRSVPASGSTTPVAARPSAPSPSPAAASPAVSSRTGTMVSVWVNARDLAALNQQFSAVAGAQGADYRVYSLDAEPNGLNKEIVRITVAPGASPDITDRILSTAAAVGQVVNTATSAGPDGQDVITAFVSGPSH